MTSIDKDAAATASAAFATARDHPARAEAARRLIENRLLAPAMTNARFQEGLRQCLVAASSGAEGLPALALAGRLAVAHAPLRPVLARLAEELLQTRLAPLSELADAEDRGRVALILEDMEAPWLAAYLAEAIAGEDSTEKLRARLLRRLLALQPLATTLDLLGTALGAQDFGRDGGGDAAARRLKRVMAALCDVLPESDTPAGAGLGVALQTFLTRPFVRHPRPAPGKLMDELAGQACALVQTVLRTQFTTLADAEVYQSLRAVREFVGAPLWPRFLRKNLEAQRVLRSLEDAIVLLAGQGLTPSTLLECLQLLAGDEAAQRLRRLGEAHPDFAPQVRELLARGGKARSTARLASMDQARAASTDSLIAALLLQAAALEAEKGSKDAGRVAQLLREVQALGAARELRLRLVGGEEVAYAPALHEVAGDPVSAGTRVRVVRPLVERRIADGSTEVVLKAIVEKTQ